MNEMTKTGRDTWKISFPDGDDYVPVGAIIVSKGGNLRTWFPSRTAADRLLAAGRIDKIMRLTHDGLRDLDVA